MFKKGKELMCGGEMGKEKESHWDEVQGISLSYGQLIQISAMSGTSSIHCKTQQIWGSEHRGEISIAMH